MTLVISETTKTRETRLFRALTFACALATAAPIFSARFLPLTDLPEHVAAMATLRHWFDPAWHVRETYTLSLGKTEYLLYHVVGALLAWPLGDAETANRVLLAIVAVAFPYSARALLRARGGDERLAIFACAAFWSRPLRIGFLPYVASVPCVLFALALGVRQLEAPTRRRAIWLGFASIAIFYLHVSGFVLFAFVSVTLIVLHGGAPMTRRAWGDLSTRAIWLAPAAMIAVVWVMRGDGPVGSGGLVNHEAQIHDADRMLFMPLHDRLHEFPLWVNDIWISHADDACAFVTWCALLWIAIASAPAPTTTLRQRLVQWAPFVCTSVLYFALPTQVGAAASVNERLALFFPIFLILVLRPRAGLLGSLPIVLAAGAAFATAAIATREIRAASREEVGDFDSLLAHTRPNSKLVSLIFHASSTHTSLGPWFQLGSYHRARKGGGASFSFTEIAHWPIHYRPEAAPPRHHAFWEFDPCVYRNAVDGSYYDYVLTRGALDPFRDDPPGPKWKVAAREKEWTLYEKIPGEENPAWNVEDRGPCESRWSAEHAPRVDR